MIELIFMNQKRSIRVYVFNSLLTDQFVSIQHARALLSAYTLAYRTFICFSCSLFRRRLNPPGLMTTPSALGTRSFSR